MMVGDDGGWTIDELICVCIARQIEDGDVLAQGLATPLVAAGYLLAWHTHAPNLYFASAIGQTVCREGASVALSRVEALWLEKAMTSFGFVQAAADLLPSVRPKEFFRPAQIDAAGNFNNIAFGADYRRPRLRLPGVGGIPDVTTMMEDIYLYVTRHSRVTFVNTIDFQSGLGHNAARRRGAGPKYLISDLGQFEFRAGRMAVLSVHPGVSAEHLKRKTGFELAVSPEVPVTEPPTADEVRLLRDVIDPLGVRRLEMLSGAKRRAAIKTILDREGDLAS